MARNELSNHDFENCSEISAMTWFRIYPNLLHFPLPIPHHQLRNMHLYHQYEQHDVNQWAPARGSVNG